MHSPQKGKKPLKNLLIPLDFKLHETFQTQRIPLKAFSLKNKEFNHKSTQSEFSLNMIRKTTDSLNISTLPTPKIPILEFFREKDEKNEENGETSLFLYFQKNQRMRSKKKFMNNLMKEQNENKNKDNFWRRNKSSEERNIHFKEKNHLNHR
jgi:hypothetical protein